VASVADVNGHGQLTLIALKKCGSSQLHKAFAEKTWDAGHFPDEWGTPRYITAVRNPAHRLVSCWHHLVKHRSDDHVDPNIKHPFGPAMCFQQWVDYVLAQEHETLNPHMRMQTLELADTLLSLDDGIIFVAQLEQITALSCGAYLPPLTKWLGRRVPVKRARKAQYGAWQNHFDRVQLQQVRWKFAADFHLWNHLLATGHKIYRTHDFARMLNLTNARHSCMV
jgi:predicted NAD-dependent protein-ADP-ribosyltransferase YbiA (DUF1768 family)